jgi:hypothetical protein
MAQRSGERQAVAGKRVEQPRVIFGDWFFGAVAQDAAPGRVVDDFPVTLVVSSRPLEDRPQLLFETMAGSVGDTTRKRSGRGAGIDIEEARNLLRERRGSATMMADASKSTNP